VLGSLLGACALVRPQLALWGVLLVAAAIDDLRVRRSWTVALPWLAAAGMVVVLLSPQMVVWHVLYGDWYVVPQGAGFMRWDAPCWSEVLFSSRNGLLPWSPAYLVFGVAVVALARRQRRLVGMLALGFALQVIVNGAAWDWWAGGSFGGRRFDSTFVIFALGATSLGGWIVRVVPPGLAMAAGARVRAIAAAAALTGLVVVALVVANLELVVQTCTTNARITGGESPAAIWQKRSDPVSGTVAGAMSSLASLPARAMFAWRHHLALDAYDRLVGVYVLGETYPGLNSFSDLRVTTLPAPVFDNAGRAGLFLGLNRRGAIEVTIPISGSATVTWNGRDVGPQFRTDDLERGINELVIVKTPTAHVGAIRIEAVD
jgi:hypothetical protein